MNSLFGRATFAVVSYFCSFSCFAQTPMPANFDGFYKGGLHSQSNFCFDGSAEARMQISNGKARLAATSGTAGDFWAYATTDVGRDGAFRVTTSASVVEGHAIPGGDFEIAITPLSYTCRWYTRLKRIGPPYRRSEHQAQPTAHLCETTREIRADRSILKTRVSSDGGWCSDEASMNWLWPWDNFELIVKPEHGEIRTRAGQTGSMIDFRPNPGFIGKDTVTIRTMKNNSISRTYEIIYDVMR